MSSIKQWFGGAIKIYNRVPQSAKASMWFLFANVFQKAVMVIFTPVFTRLMTTEEFSKYAVFQSWETILTVFATLNISNYATAKALVEYEDDRDEYVSSAEFLTIVLTLFVFGIFVLIKSVFHDFSMFPVWLLVLLFVDIISVSFFAFWSQVERFSQRYKALTIVSVLTGICSPFIAFLLIACSDYIGLYKGWSRILGLVISNGIVAVFIYYISCKNSHKFFSTKYWRFCISYCVPLIPHFLSMAFLQKIGQLFVDHYCGAKISGIFALANSLAMLMMVFNDALTKTLVPWTYQKMAAKKYDEINKPVVMSLTLLAVLDIAMALVAPELVRIFADETYAGAVYAVPPLVAVCFWGFLYNTFSNIEYFYKETKYVSIASVIAGIVIVAANLLLVPHFGFVTAAYAALLGYIVYAWMHFVFMKKTLDKHLKGRRIYNNILIFKMSLCFTVIILCIPVLYRFDFLRWGIVLLILAGVIIKRNLILETVLKFVKGGK